MHPTLLIGPADWDAARMPREEFAGRRDRGREPGWRNVPVGIDPFARAGIIVGREAAIVSSVLLF